MEIDKKYNPTHVIITNDYLECLKEIIKDDDSLLLVTSPGFIKRGEAQKLTELFSKLEVFSDIKPNPEIEHLDNQFPRFQNKNFQYIIALGGGSVMDSAKAFAVALAQKEENPLQLNLIESSEQNWQDKIKLIAIPTTSGTGSEVTPFATMWDSNTFKKYSIAYKNLYPEFAILDASLTLTLPRRLTLHTGLDAISHSLESLWNNNKTKDSQYYAIESLKLANKSFLNLLDNLDNLDLRKDMQLSSTYAGLAISCTRTAIAHSISYPMTLEFDIPHGLACSFTLPKILEQYIEVCEQIEKDTLEVTKALLKMIDFKAELSAYTKGKDFLYLKEKMFTKERAGNFIMSIDSIEEYLVLD